MRGFDAVALHFELTCECDAIVKDWWSYRTKADAKRAIKAAYLAALARAPSKAAGRRALGCLSSWYDHARDR